MAAIPSVELKKPMWPTVALFSLAFWLSGSLVLDVVIMPSMYAAGMMTQSGFPSAGYMIFGTFNRIELLCGAFVLTGILTIVNTHKSGGNWERPAILISAILLAIALIDTYGLTPHMSALGLQLNQFEQATEVPAAMNQMHGGYWLLEGIKFVGGTVLLGWFYRHLEVPAE